MPADRTVRAWVQSNPEFARQYGLARDQQLEYFADLIVEESRDSAGDFLGTNEKTGRPLWDHENVQRSRLKVDSLKWILSKLKPERYGDRIAMGGIPGQPIQTEDITSLSPVDRAQRVAALMEKARQARETVSNGATTH
jgi:hypothetical protein